MNLEPFKEDLKKCSQCGFCQSFCPLYRELKTESSSPRGKLILIKRAISQPETASRITKYLEMCLGCGLCAERCPVQIPTNLIVSAARTELLKKHNNAWQWNLFGKLFDGDHRTRSRNVRTFAFLWKAYSHKWFSLPLFVVDGIKRYAPVPAEQSLLGSLPEWLEPEGEPQGTIGVFIGCLTDQFFIESGKKALDALLDMGYRLYVPKAQRCCGAPLSHIGLESEAKKQAAHNLTAFNGVKLDGMVTVCASCGATLKTLYPKFHPSGQAFADSLEDFSQIVLRNQKHSAIRIPQSALEKVAYYDSCRLRRVMGIYKEPRAILVNAGYDLYEMTEAEQCCSFAGVFSAYHYPLAIKIAGKRVQPLKDTGVTRMVVGDPGCRVHLSDAISRAGMNIEVCHLADLL